MTDVGRRRRRRAPAKARDRIDIFIVDLGFIECAIVVLHRLGEVAEDQPFAAHYLGC
jgi:hypothetical protein